MVYASTEADVLSGAAERDGIASRFGWWRPM